MRHHKDFAGAKTEDFLRQARHFEALDNDRLTRSIKWTSGASNDHPWMVMRAQQLLKWIDDGQYEAVIAAPQRIPVQLRPMRSTRRWHDRRGLDIDTMNI
ncbi:MAG TPA: hypothetical protein VHM25_24815 [Polyangiaceae bacterium]|nr:hypothetical protein [Polyangiaceae bacterium]